MNFGFFTTPALPGLRMVVFSLALMVVVIFKRDGFIRDTLEKVRGKYAKNQ